MYRLMHSMIRQMWLLIDWNVYFEYVKNKKWQTRITVQQQITKKRKAKEKSNTDDFVYIFKHWWQKKGHEDILQFDNNMYSKITSTYWSIKLYLKLNI